jgi:transposase-like protein
VWQRKYTDEVIADAVQRVVTSGRTIADVARELGIPASTLRPWVARYRSFVPPDIRATMVDVLHEPDLPEPLRVDVPVTIYDEIAEELAEERSARGIYQVRAGQDGHGWYIDVYDETYWPLHLVTYVRHRLDGSTEKLPRPQPGAKPGMPWEPPPTAL